MLSAIEKNLLIASMELCLQDAHTLAGIQSLSTVENLVKQLRTMLTADGESVTDAHVKLAWDMLRAIETLPSRKNLSRLYRRISPSSFGTITPPSPGSGGVFDGTTLFDGSTTFDGAATASGKFDGSSTFNGAKKFDGV